VSPLIRVVIAYDSPDIRDGLSSLIDGQSDFVVVGTAGNGLSSISPSKCYDLGSTEPIDIRLAGGPLLFANSEHSTLPRLPVQIKPRRARTGAKSARCLRHQQLRKLVHSLELPGQCGDQREHNGNDTIGE